jgi:hypothetical protein
MILAVDNAEPHHRFVHLAERLVIPAIGAGIDQAADVDHLERAMQDVEVGVVRESGGRFVIGSSAHGCTFPLTNNK